MEDMSPNLELLRKRLLQQECTPSKSQHKTNNPSSTFRERPRFEVKQELKDDKKPSPDSASIYLPITHWLNESRLAQLSAILDLSPAVRRFPPVTQVRVEYEHREHSMGYYPLLEVEPNKTPKETDNLTVSFVCPLCKKRLRSLGVSQHMRSHNRKGKYGCAKCGECFTSEAEQRNHDKTHAKTTYGYKRIDKPPATVASKSSKITCPICKVVFTKRSQLKKHLRTHTSQTDFENHYNVKLIDGSPIKSKVNIAN